MNHGVAMFTLVALIIDEPISLSRCAFLCERVSVHSLAALFSFSLAPEALSHDSSCSE